MHPCTTGISTINPIHSALRSYRCDFSIIVRIERRYPLPNLGTEGMNVARTGYTAFDTIPRREDGE